MKAIITAKAPTGYQLNSLISFGLGYTKNLDGSYTSKEEFNSIKEAEEHFRERARLYNERTGGSDEELQGMYRDIAEGGSLCLDAVTAHIEETDE